MIRNWLAVGVLGAVTAALGYLYFDRAATERKLERTATELAELHKAHAVELVRAQERYISRDTQAQEALKTYEKELAAPRVVPAGDRLRDAIRSAGDRDREAASAQCAGAEHRAATYRQLLEEADGILGAGEDLAAEFSGAAEQHASEVRVLKARLEADRAP